MSLQEEGPKTLAGSLVNFLGPSPEAPKATYSGKCVLGKWQCPGPGWLLELLLGMGHNTAFSEQDVG